MAVTREEIQSARKADLYDFLLRRHPDEFKQEGCWLRMKSNPGLCTRRDYGGYKDYKTGEAGNSIDFLVKYMNYDFVTAVAGLNTGCMPAHYHDPPAREFAFPPRAPDDNAILSYLSGRGFSAGVLDMLLANGLLYQDTRNNAVFCDPMGSFYELRGTWAGKPFHQCRKKSPDCFWCFIPEGEPERAYICEGAIDAVSLYLLQLSDGRPINNAYCGIAGVANQQTIEKIKRWRPAVIAVDNDAAGKQCRTRNADLPAVIPKNKDWNEDLIHTHSVCKSCVLR